MVNQQLLDYIKRQIQQGVSQENIQNALLTAGWQKKDIEKAFNLAGPLEKSAPYNMLEAVSLQTRISSGRIYKKLIAVAIPVTLVFAVIGGGVFAYFNYFKSPERIIGKMIKKMAKVKSLEYKGQFTVEIGADSLSAIKDSFGQPKGSFSNEKTGELLIDFSGAMDILELDNPKAKFMFDLNTNILPPGQEFLGLEARIIDKIVYFKLNDIFDLGLIDVSVLKNQWIKIEAQEAKEQIQPEKLEEKLEKLQPGQDFTPEQKEQIKKAFAQAKIFKVTEKLPGEKIAGVNTYHYKFMIDREEIVQLVVELNRISGIESFSENELQELREFLEPLELLRGEIWIGKKDLLLYKITLELDAKETEKIKFKGKNNFSVQFDNYNNPVEIEIPASVKTLKEIMDDLFGGLYDETPSGFEQNFTLPEQKFPTGTVDFNKDSDSDGLADELEKLYGTDPNKPDAEDVFKDMKELENFGTPGAGNLF